jgi:hypothetical protein
LRELDDVVFTMLQCINEDRTEPKQNHREKFLQELRSKLRIPCPSCNPQGRPLDSSYTVFITGAQIRMLIEVLQDSIEANGNEEYRDIRTALERLERTLLEAAENRTSVGEHLGARDLT